MKQKVKNLTKTITALIVTFSILLVSLIGLTIAYFTDSKSYTGTLEFGNVKLKVTDGSDVEMTDGGKIPFTFGRENTSQKLMPGDTVTINFKVSLQDSSEPAYYLVSLTDTKGVFASNTYFSDGTNSYRVDTENDKVYKIAIDGTETIEATKKVGELNSSVDKHTFTIKAEIDPAYETQGGKTEVSLNIFAIQQANLVDYDADNQDKSAYHILTGKYELVTKGVNLPGVNDLENAGIGWVAGPPDDILTSVGFYYTKDVPAEYTLDTDLTSKLEAKLTGTSKGNLKIYKKADKVIAFVSDYKIMAPEDCSNLFGNISLELTSLDLSNFDTSNVTNMNRMFADCNLLTSLDLSNFDTSNVTNMADMFSICAGLTSLDLTNFDTSKVTNMIQMFDSCLNLTSLDLSNFNTSNVTSMSGMFRNRFSDYNDYIIDLTISDKFVYGATSSSVGSTQFTKADLVSKTSFNTNGKLYRNGVEITE